MIGEFSSLCDICDALLTQIQLDAENYACEFKPYSSLSISLLLHIIIP